MRAALVQMTSSDTPEENIKSALAWISEAADAGAGYVLTPEVTNCLSASRVRQQDVLYTQDQDPTLAALQEAASNHQIWLTIGSLALKTSDPEGRFANRQFLIAPDGRIAAQYDKIHMFDVAVSPEETYRESAGYRPGTQAVVADAGFAQIGLSICYDLRFPGLYRHLAQSGAQILTVPAAFSPVTGVAHWQALLQARAIETGCYVLAPAQTGEHPAVRGRRRSTFGHSMAISPWGEVLSDAGTTNGVTYVDLSMENVEEARRRVPSLTHDREFSGPDG